MKAEEIKKAEEFLKKKRPQDFDDIPKWHIEDMIEFAQQFQLPSVSEEEIWKAAEERIPLMKTFAIQHQIAFRQGAKWILSRLPQREVEQPEVKKEFNGCDSPLQTNE